MGAAVEEANRSLFVGNLDPRVTEEIIFELFHQAGPVVKVKIPKDKDGNPRQYAFVNFKHEVSAPYGLNLLNGIRLYGRPMKIQFRSGSSHVLQEDIPLWCPQGAASAESYPPFPNTRNCKPLECVVGPGFRRFQQAMLAADSQRRPAAMNSTMRQQPASGSKPEQPAYAPATYQHPPAHAFPHSAASPRRPELRKGRQGAHPYLPESRRFGERDYGRGQRGDDYGGHEQGGWETPPYEDWHREGWGYDYEYRREGYRDRDGGWHPARH